MKVFSSPITEPVYNLRDSRDAYQAKETNFLEDLKAELIHLGYKGKHTGKLFRAPVADGYAQYMIAHGKPYTHLIHLNLLDGYDLPEAYTRGLRLSDVVQEDKAVRVPMMNQRALF